MGAFFVASSFLTQQFLYCVCVFSLTYTFTARLYTFYGCVSVCVWYLPRSKDKIRVLFLLFNKLKYHDLVCSVSCIFASTTHTHFCSLSLFPRMKTLYRMFSQKKKKNLPSPRTTRDEILWWLCVVVELSDSEGIQEGG